MDTQRSINQNRKRLQLLSDKAIKDLQEAYLLEKGITISPDEAQVIGLQLLKLVDKIYKPIPIINKRKSYGK